jgi:hypothetical protein
MSANYQQMPPTNGKVRSKETGVFLFTGIIADHA